MHVSIFIQGFKLIVGCLLMCVKSITSCMEQAPR